MCKTQEARLWANILVHLNCVSGALPTSTSTIITTITVQAVYVKILNGFCHRHRNMSQFQKLKDMSKN